MKKLKNHIFDIGAYNGIDGLALAINNKKSMIHAFEANPFLIKTIYKLKKKTSVDTDNINLSNLDELFHFYGSDKANIFKKKKKKRTRLFNILREKT